VVDGLGLWITIGMGRVKFKDGPLMNKCEFSSITEVIFFTGVFIALTTSKNHEFWRVARGLQDERPSF
jgi:hypothetical protein